MTIDLINCHRRALFSVNIIDILTRRGMKTMRNVVLSLEGSSGAEAVEELCDLEEKNRHYNDCNNLFHRKF